MCSIYVYCLLLHITLAVCVYCFWFIADCSIITFMVFSLRGIIHGVEPLWYMHPATATNISYWTNTTKQDITEAHAYCTSTGGKLAWVPDYGAMEVIKNWKRIMGKIKSKITPNVISFFHRILNVDSTSRSDGFYFYPMVFIFIREFIFDYCSPLVIWDCWMPVLRFS